MAKSPATQTSKFLESLERSQPYLMVILVGAVLVALYVARSVAFASMIGVGLGVLLAPVIDGARRYLKIPRGVAGAMAGILALAVVAGIGYVTIDLVRKELVPMLERLPQAIASLRSQASGALSRLPWLQQGLENAQPASVIGNTVTKAFESIQLTTLAIGMLIFVIAVAVYSAVSPERYLKGILSAVPAYRRQKLACHLHETAWELRRWFLAQLVSMNFVGVVTLIALWAIGVEQWLVLGFLTGILEFIPYLGPFLAAFLAGIVTLASDPGLVPWVLLIFIAIQQLEGNVITPLVMKKGVALPPVILLILAAMMGSLFGILGVFVAAPILAVARILYLRTFVVKMDELSEKDQPVSEKAA